MNSGLQIRTKYNKEVDVDGEPVSPTGQYFNSKSLSVCILGILESAVPIDDSCAMPLLRDVFLPVNSRFSSIMVIDKKGVRRWKRVEVNPQDHVKVTSLPNGLPPETYDEHFDEYLTKISMDPLPENKPMWEIHVTKYPTSNAAGHLIFKLHHALGDGYSLMGALLSCLQRADDPSLPLTFPKTQSSSKDSSNGALDAIRCVPRTLSAIYNGLCDFGWIYVKSTCVPDDVTPIRSGNEDIGMKPIEISTVTLSLDHLKIIKAKLGVTINAVVTGIVSFGVRLYMQEHGTEFRKSRSTALVLLNTRNIEAYMSIQDMLKADKKLWGNKFAFLHVELPVLTTSKVSNPLEFVLEAHKDILRIRNSPAVYLTGYYLELVRKCRGPEAAARYIQSTLKKSSLGITSLIGPVEQMMLANHPSRGLYFMALGVHQSLVITVISYMRTLRIAIGVEKDFIDSKKFNLCIQNAFELIYKAATKNM